MVAIEHNLLGADFLNGWDSGSVYNESEDESLEQLEKVAIQQLCGELVEEIFDDDSYHLSSEYKAASKRYKSRAKTRKKKACKVALDKSIKKIYK